MTRPELSEITALAYIGVQSEKSQDWDAFATSLLGMQGIDKGGAFRTYRMDDRAQRLIVDGAADRPGFFGWEVTYRDQLDKVAARVEAFGIKVNIGTASLRAQRMVADLIWFHDPSGYRIEICWKPALTEDPFVPGRPIAGFKTGPLGMGHIVLHSDKFKEMLEFYRDTLRFSVSDYFMAPFPVYFFHVNGRHHSFALIGSGQTGLHHFMVELMSLDDVGQGYDLAKHDHDSVAYTLGRHTNDWMTSFYTHTPSEFFIEYGWGAREVDPQTWEPEETFDGPSFWGHDRLYLEPEAAQRMRNMALDASARGRRADDIPSCAWASSLLARDS